MKKLHIIGILVIAAAIGLLMSLSGEVATYSNFEDAQHTTGVVKLAGMLEKDKPMVYDAAIDPNYFSFFIKDTKGVSKKVVLLMAKPQEFENSETVVLTGSMRGEEFVATDVLLKCPSKYKDEEIALRNTVES